VIEAYRLASGSVPDLQLAGSMALDDPEGWDIYRQIQEASEHDPLIHVFTKLTGVGNVEVNALQRLSQLLAAIAEDRPLRPAALDERHDPVCGMAITRPEEALAERFRDVTWRFCSEDCRRRFRLAPERCVQPREGEVCS
jgi:YHS domain-containing protein